LGRQEDRSAFHRVRPWAICERNLTLFGQPVDVGEDNALECITRAWTDSLRLSSAARARLRDGGQLQALAR
jgi:hypothetical protein